MKKLSLMFLAVLVASATAGEAEADDTYEVSGTKQEKHAQRIFTGVFGQCRPVKTDETEGVVALVFEVDSSGKFGATSTFKEAEGRENLRDLVRCMGERANMARPFPKSSTDQMIGVKFSIESEDGLLMLRAGETTTLRTGEMFSWAREAPAS